VKNQSDKEILELLTSDDRQDKGCRLLLKTYGTLMYNQILRQVKYKQDAEDVMQNVLIKVLKGVSKFEGKSSLYSWLYRIAHNETINHYNKQTKYYQINSSIEQSELSIPAPKSGPEASFILKALNESVQKLPEKQQLVFELRYFNGKSYKEMSSLLKTSEGALKASYHHAVKKIEHQLSLIKSYSHE
jgi:RNA polymerase sigma-70 factor (ECF subfamily)